LLPRLLHHEAIKLVVAPTQPKSSCTIFHRLSASFPMAKKKYEIEKQIPKKRELLSLRGVVSPLLFHGKVGLACIRGHTRAPTKPHKSGYMAAAELATCHVPRILYLLLWRGDTSWHVRCSTSEDLVCHHIDFFACYCSSTAWRCIT
jgi:hypothetical protein